VYGENQMIEVFKTDIVNSFDAYRILRLLHTAFPGYNVNFDLEDCDRILRIAASEAVDTEGVRTLMETEGFSVSSLSEDLTLVGKDFTT